MRCIDLTAACHPALNLAREELLFTRLAAAGDLLLFFINTDAVIIGRNQVPWAEVQAARLATSGVPLIRRMSGGGAVFHDPGNLNFSILRHATAPGRPDTATILYPVLQALQFLGLPARLSRRNAILVDRHKISGTAQYMVADKILTHGTLLVDADLDRLKHFLTPGAGYQIHSKGRSSVRSPVINLRSLRADITIDVLRHTLKQAFAATYGSLTAAKPACEVERDAASLATDKYRSWAWNIGRSPQCTLAWEASFQWDCCRCWLDVRRGAVVQVRVRGPCERQGPLQVWAAQHLNGRRLSALPDLEGNRGEANAAKADQRAFQRWLNAHLPVPLPPF
jgi:lipoate-protein ligase A